MGASNGSYGDGTPPIAFAPRLASSETFGELFRDGMGLVEETAAYLDGSGREEARRLDRVASLAYASESMRLTTRLMQMASWLLLQRAVREGELSQEQAAAERTRVTLDGSPVDPSDPRFAVLPPTLRAIIERSARLYERIRHIDAAMKLPIDAVPTDNPVAREFGRLAAAFDRR